MKNRDNIYSHFAQVEVAGDVQASGNGVQLNPAVTGASPNVTAVGDDTNVSLDSIPKGTGICRHVSKVIEKITVDTDNTATAVTYTAAQLLGGLILRGPGGAVNDVTPTAAQIVAALPGAKVGDAFRFTIRNTAAGADTITVTAGTGVTLSGTMTIAQNNSKEFLALVTDATSGSEAVTIYSLGTQVF